MRKCSERSCDGDTAGDELDPADEHLVLGSSVKSRPQRSRRDCGDQVILALSGSPQGKVNSGTYQGVYPSAWPII